MRTKPITLLILFFSGGLFLTACEKDHTLNNFSAVAVSETPEPKQDCDPIIIDDSLFSLIQQYDTFNIEENAALYRIKGDIETYGQCIEFVVSRWVGFVLKQQGFQLVWNGEINSDEAGNVSVVLFLVHTIFPYTTWDGDGGYEDIVNKFNVIPIKEKINEVYPAAKTICINIKTYWYHVDKKLIYKIE